ncbi:peroxiredoxin family protein [Labilibaculum euxinus]
MRKITAGISIVSIMVLMLFLTIRKASKVKAGMPEKTIVELNEIPEFEFDNTENRSVSNLDLETGKSVLIIHFSPTCDFCDQEARIIFNYYSEFENSQILFVSNHSKKSITQFSEKHQLNGFPNLQFLQYKKDKFEELFGTHKLPSIFIFDTQFHLLKKIEEGVSAKTLIKYTRAANDR